MALLIRLRTKATMPPPTLVISYAVIGFVMSILWISYTSDIVVDLLAVLGLVLGLPKSLLGLTLLAWGNCMGDMNANVAMTKKGFGEMALTGCLAGPIFNIVMGLGISTISSITSSNGNPLPFSIKSKDGNSINQNAIIPLVLISAMIVVIIVLIVNGFTNNFRIKLRLALVNVGIYAIVILGLVGFTVLQGE